MILEKHLILLSLMKKIIRFFSIKYRSIILQACGEIEEISKKIYKHLEGNKKFNIYEFIKHIYDNYDDNLSSIKILLPLFNFHVYPWKGTFFVNSKTGADENFEEPNFWKAYNEIKHEGKIESATLKIAIDALAALFSLLLIRYSKKHNKNFSQEISAFHYPKIFDYPGLMPDIIIMENFFNVLILENKKKVPIFPKN